MSGFDGSGNYVRPYNWTNDAANGIDITASRFDTDGNTVATAFGNCLTRDGQGAPTTGLTWAYPLTLNSASDQTVLTIARTGGTNNPTMAVSVTESGAIVKQNLSGVSPQWQLAIGGTTAITVDSNRRLSIAAPASGTAASITAVAAGVALSATDGTVTGTLTFASTAMTIGPTSAHTLNLATNGSNRVAITSAGNITLAQTATGTVLTLQNAADATVALKLSGTSSSPVIRIDTASSTGASTPTLSSNKPGSNSGVYKWIPVNIDGTACYVPAWT